MTVLSENALRARINRKLAHEGERVVTPRYGSQSWLEYGPHFIVDDRNNLQAWSCDLENLGRELGVLRPGETLRA